MVVVVLFLLLCRQQQHNIMQTMMATSIAPPEAAEIVPMGVSGKHIKYYYVCKLVTSTI